MWLDWLVFCDCGFQTVCPLMEKDERLTVAFLWERLTEGETGSCSDGQGHALKSLIQSSVDGWSCVPSLRSNYVELMKITAASFKRSLAYTASTQCPQPCSRPLSTHASTRDSWTLAGKPESISCGVTGLFSWVLVNTSFWLCAPRVFLPSPV